jgi:hypothetical protein
MILGARVLAEFRDDPSRYADPKSRKNHAGTSPVTRASGKHRVLARHGRNRRLNDACNLWAVTTLGRPTGRRRRTAALRVETAVHLEVDVIDAVAGDEVVVGRADQSMPKQGSRCPPAAAKPQVSGRFWAPAWSFLAGTPNGVRTPVSTLRGRQCSCAEACPSHPAWSSVRARRLQTHCVHGDSSLLWDVLWDAGGATGHVDLAARQGTLAPSECPVSNEAARRISRVPPTGGLHGGCAERTSLSPVPMAQIKLIYG